VRDVPDRVDRSASPAPRAFPLYFLVLAPAMLVEIEYDERARIVAELGGLTSPCAVRPSRPPRSRGVTTQCSCPDPGSADRDDSVAVGADSGLFAEGPSVHPPRLGLTKRRGTTRMNPESTQYSRPVRPM